MRVQVISLAFAALAACGDASQVLPEGQQGEQLEQSSQTELPTESDPLKDVPSQTAAPAIDVAQPDPFAGMVRGVAYAVKEESNNGQKKYTGYRISDGKAFPAGMVPRDMCLRTGDQTGMQAERCLMIPLTSSDHAFLVPQGEVWREKICYGFSNTSQTIGTKTYQTTKYNHCKISE